MPTPDSAGKAGEEKYSLKKGSRFHRIDNKLIISGMS